MKIPLKEFEQHIDETILKRGFQYFKKGLVNEPEEIGPGEYEAIVDGTDQYTVQLSIKNDVITEYVCSCPYDMGPVCKHVVAVIFLLQQNELELCKKTNKKTGEGKKVTKKQTATEQIDGILEKVSLDDLKNYIKDKCIYDDSFRQLFLANFAYKVSSESKALYAQQIRALLKSFGDRGGYIGDSGSRQVGFVVQELLLRAEKLIETSNYTSAFYISCAVLEEMTKTFELADDSYGDIGGCIDSALDLLEDLTHQPKTDKFRNEFFDYCINTFKKETFRGWEWHLTMLDLATCLAENEEEAKLIHTQLDEIENKDIGWNATRTQGIRIELIGKIEGEEKANQFLIQHISNPDFRKIAIEKALLEEEYTAAILLAEDGLKNDIPNNQGLVDDWNDYLLQTYRCKGDTENSIKYARVLFLTSYREKKKYYTLMKSIIPSENWDEFIDQIINDLAKRRNSLAYYSLAEIYIWEERWDKLFDILKQNLSFERLDAYTQYLMKDFANEISGLYQTAILDYLEKNVSRNHYQNACRYLRKLIKMGFREKADFVMQQLQSVYPRRIALMEELKKV